jgi:hypothetical protein
MPREICNSGVNFWPAMTPVRKRFSDIQSGAISLQAIDNAYVFLTISALQVTLGIMQVTSALDSDTLPPSAAPRKSRVRGAKRPRRVSEQMTQIVPIDRRTRVGREVAAFRASLLAHVGENASVTQRATVELACQLRVRLVAMDLEFAEGGGAMTAHDSRTYLAWANSLARVLNRLGIQAAPSRTPSLAELMAQPQGTAAA